MGFWFIWQTVILPFGHLLHRISIPGTTCENIGKFQMAYNNGLYGITSMLPKDIMGPLLVLLLKL